MDPAGELAQLFERLRRAAAGARRARRARGRRRLEPASTQAQAQRQRDEALLGAVVEVALEAAALGVAGLDDARPRGGEPLARVGVGQRLGDQLGEVAQPALGVLAEPAGSRAEATSAPHSLPPT